MWTYEESLAWLYARQALGIKLGLGKVESLLQALGDPHRAFQSIHVAGTNGKGSVTRMLAETLRRAGYRTGCTTSPHLVSFAERIELDGDPIARPEVARLLAGIRPAVEALDAAGDPPTFFEVVTALAFCAFRDAGIDWAVVETGMGGRLDATNVLLPRLTVITNVTLDHERFLGSTVAAIAAEKAGIMKPHVPCVTACTGDALAVVKARSHEVEAPMSIVGHDYQVVPDARHLVLLRPTGEARYEVGLAGAHQRENAAVVVAAVEALRAGGTPVPERAVQEGLRHARNPGRLELLDVDAATWGGHGRMEVLVDGAHNPAAARALRQHLLDTGWSGFDLVVGFCADKRWQEALDEWLLPAARLWAVPVRNPRSLDPASLRAAGSAAGVRSATCRDLAEALRHAAAAGARRLVVAGSLFLAGEALAVLRGQPLEEIHGAQ
ncbi:MAG TPA: folylpolyglutamate synthase/dihydrofolate synthase family protein [Candidatus Thermoplasmatota archaeon]|nr:folylpolyglutamate synthase/dihydrofolate synthase family protein [Candidatus Thermoplasmatota archaeon]